MKPLLLACDATPYGVGAVISHFMENGEETPIAFASRTLTASEGNYFHIEKEALSIMFGLKKFHSYLYGLGRLHSLQIISRCSRFFVKSGFFRNYIEI